MVIKSLLSVLALSTLLTSATGSTEPLTLTEVQLDDVTAGGRKRGVAVGTTALIGSVTVFGSKPGLGVGTGGVIKPASAGGGIEK